VWGGWVLDVERYAWIESERFDAFTLAVAQGVTEDALIRVYGGDPDAGRLATFEESMGDPDGSFFVQTLTVGGLVVAIENNGWTGNVAEIARRATTAGGGRFTSVYWCSAIGTLGVLYAVAATVRGWHHDRSGDERVPAEIPEWRAATTAEANPVAAAVALLDRIMGVRVQSEWFTNPRRTTPIPEVVQLLPQVSLGRNISDGDISQSDPAAWRP
jgi:hypothetical protein